MMRRDTRNVLLLAVMILVLALPSAARAHEVTHQGTVQAVETERLQVQVMTEGGEDAELIWFKVTADTKVRRGEAELVYADAAIDQGERIVVLVNNDFDATEALVLRLAAR